MILYLHGFASGPASKKAQFFQSRFLERGREMMIPDLAAGDFENLTITSQLAVVERAAAGRPVSLIGSSLGGYLAALYASRHPEVEKLVLLAPGFGFPSRWPDSLGPERVAEWKRTGVLPVFHYGEGRERLLRWSIIEDGQRYEDFPPAGQPTMIFHGKNDTVVPPFLSEQFAAGKRNVTLEILDSDHELMNVLEYLWARMSEFLR